MNKDIWILDDKSGGRLILSNQDQVYDLDKCQDNFIVFSFVLDFFVSGGLF